MKFLTCLFCEGELDIVGEEGYRKIVKCRSCNKHEVSSFQKKEPEVTIIRKIRVSE